MARLPAHSTKIPAR